MFSFIILQIQFKYMRNLIFLAFFFAKIFTLEIITDLQPVKQHVQEISQIAITLYPSFPFIREIDYFQPQYISNPECRYRAGELREQVIGAITLQQEQPDQQNASNQFANLKNKKNNVYAYSQKYQQVYTLAEKSMYIHQLKLKERQVLYLGKIEIANKECGGQIVISSDEQFLFYFSCNKIARIELKKSLSGIKYLSTVKQNFYGHKVLQMNKLYVWISFNEGVRVYKTSNDNNLTLFQTLSPFFSEKIQNNPESITDFQLTPSNLYLLGHISTLFIYAQKGDGQYQSKKNFSLLTICSFHCRHRKILVNAEAIYIYSIENGEQFISQFQVIGDFEKLHFIRFFKGGRNFIEMSIFNKKLMAIYQHIVNLYEINRDPRTIKRLLNGISNSHFQQINNQVQLTQSLAIRQAQSKISLIRVSASKPSVICEFKQKTKKQKPIAFNLTQLCHQPENTGQRKYYQSCLKTEVFKINVEEPKKQYHIFAVIAVFIFSVAVVVVLIIWRKSKIDIIQSIVMEINKIKRKRNAQKIQFVEEKNVVRETNWNELHESYGAQQNDEQFQNGDGASADVQMSQKISRNERANSKAEQKQALQQQKEEILDQGEVQGTQRNMMLNKNSGD